VRTAPERFPSTRAGDRPALPAAQQIGGAVERDRHHTQ
jgi:hypothetical protein